MRSFFNPFTAIGFGIAIGLTGVHAVNVFTSHLEMSAVTQCSRRDWPSDKDKAMTDWCIEFNATRAQYGRY